MRRQECDWILPVDEQVVEEGRDGAVVGIAAEQEELVRIAGRGESAGKE